MLAEPVTNMRAQYGGIGSVSLLLLNQKRKLWTNVEGSRSKQAI